MTKFDNVISSFFFSPDKNIWMIDGSNIDNRLIFYTLPKFTVVALITILCGIPLLFRICFAFYVGAPQLKEQLHKDIYNIKAAYVIICVSLSAIIVAILKHKTCIDCPYDILEYGGTKEYCDIEKRFMEWISEMNWGSEYNYNCGKCFPAAHSVVGFGLICIPNIAKNNRSLYEFISIALGLWCSFYQIATGAHFLSHCIISLIICIIVSEIFRKLMLDKWRTDYLISH